MMYRIALVILGLLFIVPAEAQQQEFSADFVLKKMKERFNEVKDYTAELTAEVHFEKMRLPKMEAVIYYKQPDKYHFEPKGGSFAMLPKDAVAFNPSTLATEMYDVVVQGRERVGNVDCVKVKMLAKSDSLRMQRLLLYVDPQFWVVKKLSTTPDKGASAEALFDHELVQNKYLMNSKITLTIDAPAFNMRKFKEGAAMDQQRGTVVVTYANYKVNTGLSDELFKKKK